MKNNLRMAEGVFIVTLLITLLLCQGLFAAEETLPTPEEIIAKNIEAIGGKDACEKIYNAKRFSIRKFIQTNMINKITDYQERPDKEYVLAEAALPDTENVSGERPMGILRAGSNGKMAWEIFPDAAPRHLLEGDQLSIRLLQARFDTIFYGYDDAIYKSMKTDGIEQINGKDCYKVVKTSEKGEEKTVYYDKKSFMIVKTTVNNKTPQGIKKWEAYNEEYKKINGILFPYKKVNYLNGQRYEEITYENIELNIKMPEGIFDIPEEVKAIMNKTD